jgi:hypothetical protein
MLLVHGSNSCLEFWWFVLPKNGNQIHKHKNWKMEKTFFNTNLGFTGKNNFNVRLF